MAAFGKFILYVALAIPATWLRATTLAQLYIWFIVPTYHVSPITPGTAYGITLLVHLMTYVIPPNRFKTKDEDGFLITLFAGCVISAFALGFGWLIHRWWA